MNREELLAKAKPILFNTEMVRAILDGRKTVTRRAVKHNTEVVLKSASTHIDFRDCSDAQIIDMLCVPPYKLGDILYVRETWQREDTGSFDEVNPCNYIYKADYSDELLNTDGDSGEVLSDFPWCIKWKPSIHMPKEAARIFLRVTSIHMERLQDMIPNDFKHEGIIKECAGCTHFHDLCGGMVHIAADCKIDRTINYSSVFAELWDRTIKKQDLAICGWDANPWVWVIEFERIEEE